MTLDQLNEKRIVDSWIKKAGPWTTALLPPLLKAGGVAVMQTLHPVMECGARTADCGCSAFVSRSIL